MTRQDSIHHTHLHHYHNYAGIVYKQGYQNEDEIIITMQHDRRARALLEEEDLQQVREVNVLEDRTQRDDCIGGDGIECSGDDNTPATAHPVTLLPPMARISQSSVINVNVNRGQDSGEQVKR